jgi:type IV pilus assembly protein PilP
MRTILATALVVLVLACLTQPLGAQAPASGQTAPAPAAPSGTVPEEPAAAPAPPESYTYQPEGRRDPFLNLRAVGVEPALPARRGDGPAGMTSDEISVRGVLKSRGSLIAMIQGPDKKTYVVHQGDALMDGTVKAVIPEGLVIVQQINDPLSLVKQREVRKLLRSAEEAKE